MDARTIFGGNPVGIIIRLVLLSLVVGVVLSAMGITPDNLFYRLNILLEKLYEMGFGAVEWVLGYIVLGAMIVIPIWLISRFFGLLGARKNDRLDR